MTDPDLLDRAVAAFTAAVQEHREAAVALDRYRIGAWLREREHADLARAIEHGDHIGYDQLAIPSLRLVIAARNGFQRRADAADAEVKRLRDLVREAYVEGWHDAPEDYWQATPADRDPSAAWEESNAYTALGEPR